ncbi:MAG: diacylglycerol/lipid kinase family protein, partial [Actinomycetota bacterium]
MVARKQKRSAVLIVNPGAGRASQARRSEVIAAARERLDIDVFETDGPTSGIEITKRAIKDGAELVIAFGGDGIVNEVANGASGSAAAVGILPGGTMNVLARDLGIPADAISAVAHLDRALEAEPRTIPLGRLDDRLFTFSAGCGFDAEAAEVVEAHARSKRLLGELFFYLSALRVLAGSYRHRGPSMTLTGEFGTVEVSMAITCNAGPYAYLLDKPVRLTPEVDLDGGLDLFALKRMRLEALPFYAFKAVLGGLNDHPDAFYA